MPNTLKTSLPAILAVLLFTAPLSTALADAEADKAAVAAAAKGFFDALSSRDVKKMDAIWANDPDTIHVGPFASSVLKGYPAAREDLAHVLSNMADFSVKIIDGPYVHVNGDTGSALSMTVAVGKTKDGHDVNFKAFSSEVFVRRDGKWLIVSEHASMLPKQ